MIGTSSGSGCYAIVSGLLIVFATGVVLAPVFHHVLHRFNVETDEGDSCCDVCGRALPRASARS